MIKYEVYDLISAAKEGKVNVIAHCCNCFNTMKSGIAPLVAKAFPGAERVDKQTKRGDKSKLGGLTESFCVEYGVAVYNLYGQFGFWGRREGKMDLDYNALDSSLSKMAADLHAWCRIIDYDPKEFRIGLPKLGAGLAGGDWSLISVMIARHLGMFDVTIYVLKESDIG